MKASSPRIAPAREAVEGDNVTHAAITGAVQSAVIVGVVIFISNERRLPADELSWFNISIVWLAGAAAFAALHAWQGKR